MGRKGRREGRERERREDPLTCLPSSQNPRSATDFSNNVVADYVLPAHFMQSPVTSHLKRQEFRYSTRLNRARCISEHLRASARRIMKTFFMHGIREV